MELTYGLTKPVLPVSVHTDHISNSVILSNGYVNVAKCFAPMYTSEENSVTNEAIVLSDWFQVPCETTKVHCSL